jgi:hypothetical protein
VLTEFESEMLERSAIKHSAEAALPLHSEIVPEGDDSEDAA